MQQDSHPAAPPKAGSRLRVTLSRGRGRSKDSFYTFLILPSARGRFRKLQVSRTFLACIATLALLVTLAGLLAPHLFFRLETQNTELESLRLQNRQLLAERERFEGALGEISERLDRFESQAGHFAAVLGVAGAAVDRPAAGGPGVGPGAGALLEQDLSALDSRASFLDQSLDHLDAALRERLRMLSSTPSTMPVQGWFSHGFGWRKDPFSGLRQFHRGIDIVAEAGTPIQATADGIVSRAARLVDYGKTVDLSHGQGYITRYGHMSEILVRPGQRVRRGEVIGRVGSTGRSTGPHLHYEIFRDGRRVNPWKYLGQKGR